jgi:phosphoserine aminotransferase
VLTTAIKDAGRAFTDKPRWQRFCIIAAGPLMNVVFRLPSEELEKKFVAESEKAGMLGLKGHRSVGGCRASLYNGMPLEGARALASLMKDFAAKNG